MARIIAVANQKGGVAKTTSTYNLAAVKAMEGKRVLMIDLDPQASLTIAAGLKPCAEEGYSGDLFEKNSDPVRCLKELPSDSFEGRLVIIPSDIQLAGMEMQLVSASARERRLKKSVDKIKDYFDYIFLDCPPQFGILTISALICANEVCIPVKVDYLAYRALDPMFDTIHEIQEDDGLNPELKVTGLIPTFFEINVNEQNHVLELIREKGKVLTIVRKAAAVSNKTREGLPVVVTHPDVAVSGAYREAANMF